jgi:hypothetical protein
MLGSTRKWVSVRGIRGGGIKRHLVTLGCVSSDNVIIVSATGQHGAILASLLRKLRSPDSCKEVLAFVLVLAVELYFLVVLATRAGRPAAVAAEVLVFVLPAYGFANALRLQDELSDLVSLALFLGSNVLPPKHAVTLGAAYIRDGMRPCDQLSGDRLVSVRVWETTKRSTTAQVGSIRRWRCNKIRAAMTTSEAFAYYLRSQAKVRKTSRTAQVRGIAIKVGGWRGSQRARIGRSPRSSRCSRVSARATAERKRRNQIRGKNRRRGRER